MLSSRRVEGCAIKRWVERGRFRSEMRGDDVHSAAFAPRAGAVKRGPLLIGEQLCAVCSGGVEMESAEGQRLSAIAVGEQAEVTDFDEA